MERLVIEALNVVFEDTTLRAEDDEEVFNEDFWITEDGNRVALAEVKGVNSGVKRAHINQVDNHREELSLDPDEMPGVLVLNVHRLDTNLERKLQERVHPSIIALLRRQNALLLRTADLYALIHRRLAGASAHELVSHGLREGGGAGGWR